MANTILLKRNSNAGVIPSAGVLALGELAINTVDGKLYAKKNDGTVALIGPTPQNTATVTKGSSVINFGAFPGNSDASLAVTGQALIVAGSFVQAWLIPTTTADHTADEHLVDSPRIMAGNIIAGIGFTIYGIAMPGAYIDDAIVGNDLFKITANSPLVYGQWSVAWTWS